MIQLLKILTYFGAITVLTITILSCERLGMTEDNPFEQNQINQDTVNFIFEDIDPNSIAGLYQNIFKPTCANVGCHDGNFEPDFRTIESSYHSMVYREPVKNDGSLTYRVDPGNPDQSAIIKRMNGSIEPEMPIEIEPDGDWLEKGDEYIQNVRTWIENGALDLAGNSPQSDFANPSLFGAIAMNNGELLGRISGYGSIKVPSSVDVIELFLAFDPLNEPQEFKGNELAFGYEDDEGFHKSTSVVMEILNSPLSQYGLYGTLVDYTHKVELDLAALLLVEDEYFMRVSVQDGTHPITEIPVNNGLYHIKEYMSFHRTD